MNWLDKADRVLDKVSVFSKWANTVGMGIFFVMVCFNFLDVLLRYVFNRPITGAMEITELMMVLVVALAIGYAQSQKSHVAVDVIVARLSSNTRLVLNATTNFISLGVCGIMVWRSAAQANYFWQHSVLQGFNAPVPRVPFAAVVTIGCTLLALLFLRDFLSNLSEIVKLHFKGYVWLLIFGIPAVVLVLSIFWLQPDLWQLNLTTVAIIGIACFLIFLLSGTPIALAMILVGFLFVGHIRGINTAFDVVGTEIYATWSSYHWSVLAFFVLMGFFCLWARFGEDIYFLCYRWLGHISGGLAIATNTACTGMAAIVGDTFSVVSTMATVALPEMRKYKYHDRISTGTIAAGACLGPLIPPSMGFITYALLTEQSIGKLFIAGIFPGLLLSAGFMAIIYTSCKINPAMGPSGEKATWKERVTSSGAGIPVALLFLLVVGGIYAGIFTPLEGGAMGAFGALLLGLLYRRFTWNGFNNALLGAGRVVAFVFLILVSAIIFTRFIAWCNLSGMFQNFITGLGLPPSGIILIMMLIFFILGFVMDLLPIVLILVPIFHPIAVGLNFDPIWFTVLVVMTTQLGIITPPVAINLFLVRGMAKDIPMSTIYRGIIPFCIGYIVVIGLVFVAPPIATWLPGLLY